MSLLKQNTSFSWTLLLYVYGISIYQMFYFLKTGKMIIYVDCISIYHIFSSAKTKMQNHQTKETPFQILTFLFMAFHNFCFACRYHQMTTPTLDSLYQHFPLFSTPVSSQHKDSVLFPINFCPNLNNFFNVHNFKMSPQN